MKYAILQLMKEAAPGFVSGGELGKRFHVSRTAVWKYIEELRQEGYSIEAVPRNGYRLLSSKDRLNAYEIANDLNTSVAGNEVVYLDTVDSTNNYARKMADEGCVDGFTVIAGQQTAGKGRLGRSWASPNGSGIYVSIVLRPPLAPSETQIFTLAAAAALVNAIRETTGLKAGIKWPNDVVIDGRKLCGILTEMNSEADRVNYIILGIGINYSQEAEDFPEELRNRAISLKIAAAERIDGRSGIVADADKSAAGKDNAGKSEAYNPGAGKLDADKPAAAAQKEQHFSKLSIVRSLLRELDSVIQMVLSFDNAKILDMWRENSVTLGRKVGFRLKDTEYTGTAVDITVDGRLSVECSDGVRRDLLSGEVSVNGIYGYR